jgi:pre-mRNA-splicing factor ATP-dependent RNA helicase DHX15/PRP43
MSHLKKAMKMRPDFKVVIMSATLDAQKFRDFFDGAPLFEVPGRMYPVEIMYVAPPPTADEDDDKVLVYPTINTAKPIDQAIDMVFYIHATQLPGDILVFVSGVDEINEIRQGIERKLRNAKPFAPLVVYGLSAKMNDEQEQAVHSKAPIAESGECGRKVVIATNVAETSVTIDGLVYVVDLGFSKVSVYNPRNRSSYLHKKYISKAEAAQRSGRAGRTRPGKCFRLYLESVFNDNFAAQPIPAIQRDQMTSTILSLINGGFPLITFDYVDAPMTESLISALDELYYLRLIEEDPAGLCTTDLGKQIAKIPLDLHLALSLVRSPDFGCSVQVACVIAMLQATEKANLWTMLRKNSPLEQDQKRVKKRFTHASGDHITLLQIYEFWTQWQNDQPVNTSHDNFGDMYYMNTACLRRADDFFEKLLGSMQSARIRFCSLNYDIGVQYFAGTLQALCAGHFLRSAFKAANNGGSIFTTFRSDLNAAIDLHWKFSGDVWVIYDNCLIQPDNPSDTKLKTISKVDPLWLIEASVSCYAPFQLRQDSAIHAKIKANLASVIGRATGMENVDRMVRHPLMP